MNTSGRARNNPGPRCGRPQHRTDHQRPNLRRWPGAYFSALSEPLNQKNDLNLLIPMMKEENSEFQLAADEMKRPAPGLRADSHSRR
jgi:hypothetical protein